jgi:hypothetical protein
VLHVLMRNQGARQTATRSIFSRVSDAVRSVVAPSAPSLRVERVEVPVAVSA